jgi:ribonuclease J
MSENRFTWTPLGGLGEVGMNCMVFQFGKTKIPVDAGVVFADDNDYGIDAVYPDFRKLLSQNIKHWLITHGHEDHIGAVPAVFHLCKNLNIEAPHFYAPPLAYALLNQKLSDSHYAGVQKYRDNLHVVEAGTELTFEDVKVKFIEIRHSTLESCSLAFEWKNLRAIHSADFKLDYHEFEDGNISLKSFDVFNGKKADFLFMDSTNAESRGQSISEMEIKDNLEKVIKETEGRLFVTLFSSNVYRVALIAHLAEKCGRRVVLAGRSMKQTYQASKTLGLLKKCPPFSETTLIEAEESVNLDPRKVLVICSGSQGEFRSVLSKIASASHPVFRPNEKDTVLFSSKMIPGNERTIMRLIDGLLQHDIQVLWGEKAEEKIGGPIHASGHGRSEELKELIRHVKPARVIPVHGALHQLKATVDLVKEVALENKISIETTIALNNSKLEFEQGEDKWELVDHYYETTPQEKFLRLEYFDTPSRDPFLKNRKFAGDGGCLSLAIDSLGRVQAEMKGIVPDNYIFSNDLTKEKIISEIENFASHKIKVLEASGDLRPTKLPSIKQTLEEELARMIKKQTGSRPLVFVHFTQ